MLNIIKEFLTVALTHNWGNGFLTVYELTVPPEFKNRGIIRANYVNIAVVEGPLNEGITSAVIPFINTEENNSCFIYEGIINSSELIAIKKSINDIRLEECTLLANVNITMLGNKEIAELYMNRVNPIYALDTYLEISKHTIKEKEK